MQSVQPLDISTTRQELRLQNGNLRRMHNGNDGMKVKEKKQTVWCVCVCARARACAWPIYL